MQFNSDIKRKKIIKLIKRLGLEIKEGAKHTKATCIHNNKITLIPRHNFIKKSTANEILEQLKKMGFNDDDVERNF